MEFAVVKFIDKNVVDVVPCSWLYEDKVYWPPKNIAPKVLPLRRQKISPAEYWDLLSAYTLGIFETWEDAERKLKIAQVRSDLESTDPEELGRGKRVRTQRLGADISSDDSDIIPDTPKFVGKRKSNKENKRPLIEKLLATDTNGDNTNAASSPILSCNAAAQSGDKTNDDSFTLSTLSDQWDIPELNCQSSSQSLLINKSTYGNRESSVDVNKPFSAASCSILSNKQVEGYLKAILRNVISVKNRIKNVEDNQVSLQAKINEIDCVKTDKIQNLPNDLAKLLPLSTLDEFNKLEEKLGDEVTKKQMVSYLQRVGGGGFRQAVTLMLKKVLTNSLAAKFSFLGQRGKYNFKASKICSVICEIATSNNILNGATEDSVSKVVAEWLRHAKSRNERKKTSRNLSEE